VVNSFSLSDFSYMWLDKDTVVMTYTGTQDATCDGKKQGGKVFATSIWQRKGGKWLSPFHQETEAGKHVDGENNSHLSCQISFLENINSSEGMKLGCGTIVACLSSVPSPTFEMLAAVRVARGNGAFYANV